MREGSFPPPPPNTSELESPVAQPEPRGPPGVGGAARGAGGRAFLIGDIPDISGIRERCVPAHRQRPPRSSNLPLRSKINVARLERFELPTRCLEGSCSIHLSYRRAK